MLLSDMFKLLGVLSNAVLLRCSDFVALMV